MTTLIVTLDGQAYEIELTLPPQSSDTYQAMVDGEPVEVTIPDMDRPVTEMEWLIVDGRPYELLVDPDMRWIKAYDGIHPVEVRDKNEQTVRTRSSDGRVKAPIPGLISRILVSAGEAVTAGQPVIMLEAMKMENEIRAPADGVVVAIPVSPGETVVRNQVLVELN